MTKQEAIAAHRKMWRWIADETERRQSVVEPAEYFDAIGIPEGDRPYLCDYCCEYDNTVGDGNCTLCPIKWPTAKCWYKTGLYTQWSHAYKDWHKAAAIARQIAELPEKEGLIRLIDKDESKAVIKYLRKNIAREMPDETLDTIIGLISCHIDAQPTVDAEPVRHGEWVEMYQEDVMFEGVYKCSICGEMYALTDGTPEDNIYNYCPKCGAKMDGRQRRAEGSPPYAGERRLKQNYEKDKN